MPVSSTDFPGDDELVTRETPVQRRRLRAAWLFLTPMLVCLVLVAAWPLLRTFWFSLTDADLSDTGSGSFVGLSNYLLYDGVIWSGVLVDPQWWNAVRNTLHFTVVSVGLEMVLGLMVALLLNVKFTGRALVRALILIPWAIPTIVSAKIWSWMLNDQFGIINHMMLSLGLIDAPLAWTADADLSMWAVIIVDVWKTVPFVTLLMLAALQMLPSDCYEAARGDGIHPVRVFWRVTLPLLMPALLVAAIFRILDSLRVFDVIYVLTSNSSSTMSMSVYARQHLVEFQDVGYGSAASTLLFLVVAVIAMLYLYLGRRQLEVRS
ncbi:MULTISPECIES: carbohydrate ABC transporter permease [Pseudomonas syringae group]|uniref:Binding-protein dependent transport system inner membrane protein n=2 Tax=Pseudomonas syringae group TaxID=136849 RepID=A0A0P9MUW1_PSESX|nr:MULTISPECIES: sugar ABC transporter permease [Pseudomonas syringae group]KPW95760.1 Binding-protein dependent transport system inner membrane protein [Pseudomonas syringae pv. castaneae]KWS88580.1 ABC transporter permease [Pseudomonas syringae pv. castaneae]RMS91982.1 Binding-protein dependent transport system inner membrane protein [Pseudomonas savastanoi]